MIKGNRGEELIKCPCCDKMIPTINMELSYRLPDTIANLDEGDREEQCQYNEDYVVCKGTYFYVRCIIALPLHDFGRDYGLGAWAQISPDSFNHILALRDQQDQSSEPPMRGLLANNIHLSTHCYNSEIEIRLTNSTSVPMIIIKDPQCSLYNEQQCGISIHRAIEYTELCPKN